MSSTPLGILAQVNSIQKSLTSDAIAINRIRNLGLEKGLNFIIRKKNGYIEALQDDSVFFGGSGWAKNVNGTDATAVINAALIVFPGEIRVKQATYDLAGPLVITGAHTHLKMERGTVLNQRTLNADVIQITPPSATIDEVIIEGGKLIADPSIAATTLGSGVFVSPGVWYSQIKSMEIQNLYRGIFANATYANRSARNTVDHVHMTGIDYIAAEFVECDSWTLNDVAIQDSLAGIYLLEITQGFVINNTRMDSILYDGYYVSAQEIHFNDNMLSRCGIGVHVVTGSSGLRFKKLYNEAATYEGVLLENTGPFNLNDIKFSGGRVVRCGKQGFAFTGHEGYPITDIAVRGISVVNNGKSGSFGGIYSWDYTNNVEISHNNIGNDALDSSLSQQQSVGTSHNCDAWTVKDNDVSTAQVLNQYNIELAGSNNHRENNRGYKSRSIVDATVGNNSTVAHGLVYIPTKYFAVAKTAVDGSGNPIIVAASFADGTNITVTVLTYSSGAWVWHSAVDIPVTVYAEYDP